MDLTRKEHNYPSHSTLPNGGGGTCQGTAPPSPDATPHEATPRRRWSRGRAQGGPSSRELTRSLEGPLAGTASAGEPRESAPRGGGAEGGDPWGDTSSARAWTPSTALQRAAREQRPGKDINQLLDHISCSERFCKTWEKIDLSGGIDGPR